MTVLELRNALASLLSASLGTYTLGNGSTTPAISVRAVGERRPVDTTVTGMEVVIVRDPELSPIDAYKDPGAFREWTVYLIDWSDATSLEAPAAAVVAAYPGTLVQAANVPKGVGPQNQIELTIRFQ
jgi:hypothetical protein